MLLNTLHDAFCIQIQHWNHQQVCALKSKYVSECELSSLIG